MSDKEDDSKPSSSESSKHTLKTATTKLKAEALRRFQLNDAEYDDAKPGENGDANVSRESSNVTNSSKDEQNPDHTNKEGTSLSTGSDEIQQDGTNPETSVEQNQGSASKNDEENKDGHEGVQASRSNENNDKNVDVDLAKKANEPSSSEQEETKDDAGSTKADLSSNIDNNQEDNDVTASSKDTVVETQNPAANTASGSADTSEPKTAEQTLTTAGKDSMEDVSQSNAKETNVEKETTASQSKEQDSAMRDDKGSEQSGKEKESEVDEKEIEKDKKGKEGEIDGKQIDGGKVKGGEEGGKSKETNEDTNGTESDKGKEDGMDGKGSEKDKKGKEGEKDGKGIDGGKGKGGEEGEKAKESKEDTNGTESGEQQKEDEQVEKVKESAQGELEKENKAGDSVAESTRAKDSSDSPNKDSTSDQTNKDSTGLGETSKSGNKEISATTDDNNTKNASNEDNAGLQSTGTKTLNSNNVDKSANPEQSRNGEEKSDEISPPMSETDANKTSDTSVSATEEAGDKNAAESVDKDKLGTDQKSVTKQDEKGDNTEDKAEQDKTTADEKAETSQEGGGESTSTKDETKGDKIDEESKKAKEQGEVEGSAEKEASEEPKVSQDQADASKEDISATDADKTTLETSKGDEKTEGKDSKKKSDEEDKKEAGENVGEEGQQSEGDASQEDMPKEEGGGEKETVLADDFFYEFEEFVSKPYTSEGIPSELLTLHHSFGYECTKRENILVMDEETILFSAGNMVQLLNIKTQEQSYFRTTGGGGIGAIAIHPSRKYFAVAEKGIKPNINIFEYPSLKMYRVLREGTEEAYSNLDFSPDGTMLASVGCAPDFMLTVWDWKNEKILLRYKAFAQDIYKVAFSPDNEGHVNTSGSGHIRFWTMADTFTGLKLQGMIGKFGAKELSDIEGFVELPDGKVLSGCDWGNMLLWEGGLIKVEISKKGKKTCHHGMIQQFFMDEGELMTIGADGFVKVWDFESIDNADTDDEGTVFEVDPMYELKVGTDVKLMSMQKAVNSEAPIWYAQDAGGGIWKLDLSFTHTSHAPERMFSFHAGRITGLDTSPVAHFVATSGQDYTVRVYDYLTKKQICSTRFNTGSSTLLWVPKIVDTKGTNILAGFDDGVVRLLTLNKVDLSQVRSKKSKPNYELNLTQVFKPHTKPVTVMTIDDKGELLATGSSDCTVFFFTIDDTYKPIGFVETASPVVSIEWSDKGKKGRSVLVSCKDGTVLEVEAPQPGEHDTSKTFHLPLKNLQITEYYFKRVKDKLRKAEADAIKAKEKEAKRKKKEAERARRRERGLDEVEEQQEEEEEEEEEKEEQQDHGPSEIIKGFYHGKKENFFLSMDGWDAGYLYECEFSDKPAPSAGAEDTSVEPIRSIRVDNSLDAPIRSIYTTHSKKFLLFGMGDGIIRIHPLEDGTDLENLSSYWSFSIHDNHNGAITNINTSFDDKYVFTTGADGNFFVHKFMDKAVKGIKIPHKVSLPSPKKLIGEDGQEIKAKVDDIDDPNFYSIEHEKQKAEHDRMVKLAEEKKQNVRRKITNLRRAFKQLMSRNQGLPGHVQLKTEEFIIDPEMKKDLKAKTQEKIDFVHKELAWETEKHSIGLKKMQKRFKDEIECERIVLRAFNSDHLVSTFRASKPDYLELLQKGGVDKNKSGETHDGAPRKSIQGVRQLRRQSTQEKVEKPPQQQQQQQQAQSQLGGKVAKALEKAEARRLKRLNRQAQWDELYRNKPDENYEDPKDKAAIKEARENMGDYKLKTAKDYVVPESQRVNADKKRLQLLKLVDQIHQYKFDFNQNFLGLRKKKIAIIKQAKDNTVKILDIQKKMDAYARRPIPKVPEMKPDEQPEKRLEYTRERLLEYKKQITDTTKSGGGQDDGGSFGGFGGFGGGGGGEPTKASMGKTGGQRDRSMSSVSIHSSGRPKSSFSGTDKGTPEPTLEEVPEEPTPLELMMLEEEQIKLQYEQDLLIDNITSMMNMFDADLRTLRHDKAHLEIALKCADLRQVTLFEEFMLLKEFEKRENVFANKVNTKINEKEQMQDKVEDCQMALETKKQEIDKLLEQEKALYTTFSTAMGENNKFENFLTKVFKKKIKRAKKKPQTEEGGSDDDSDEEDSDEDLSSSDEEDSDAEELDDSVCPPGCDQALFDQICQMREKKLDLEELLADEKKASETLKKEYDSLVKKSKVIDSALNTAEADLEAFQREKQQKLNELDVVVILRLSQIQHMINSAIPQDLSQSLIFNAPGLNQLQYRIKGLEKEKHEQKRLYREHRQKHVQLIRDKKVMESRIAELEEKVQNMMMLKFGRLVDLEKLEKVTVSRTVEELKEKLRQQEVKSSQDIAKWDTKIDSYKEKTTQLTRENTQRLDTFTILLQEKKELEQMLDSRQKTLGTEFTGARKADLRERQRLIQLVQLQAQEIDALKDEITLLSRKGGHILPPAQPPLPPGQTPIPNT